MIDITQALLVLVVITLTAVLVALGLQVFFILKEIRWTIQKANKVLDDTGLISESISKPISAFSTMLLGIRGGQKVMTWLNRNNEVKEEK